MLALLLHPGQVADELPPESVVGAVGAHAPESEVPLPGGVGGEGGGPAGAVGVDGQDDQLGSAVGVAAGRVDGQHRAGWPDTQDPNAPLQRWQALDGRCPVHSGKKIDDVGEDRMAPTVRCQLR